MSSLINHASIVKYLNFNNLILKIYVYKRPIIANAVFVIAFSFKML